MMERDSGRSQAGKNGFWLGVVSLFLVTAVQLGFSGGG